jgi:hypothetical protein
MLKKILIGVAGVLIAVQFIPVDRSNPPAEGEIMESTELKTILKRSCYDCHSNETVWPWYSYVAPVSWLVADDVHEGRKHLNFSNWQNIEVRKVSKAKQEIWEMVSEGEMPLGKYVLLHPEAKLSEKDKQIIKDWTGE